MNYPRIELPKSEVCYHKLFTIIAAGSISVLFIFGLWKIAFIILVLPCVLLSIGKEEYLFLFWLFTFSFFTIDPNAILKVGTHPLLTYNRIFIPFILVVFLIGIALDRRRLKPMGSIEILFVIFLMVLIYSMVSQSSNILTGLRYLIDCFVLPFIVYFLARNLIIDKNYLTKFVNILILVGSYISISGIYEYLSGKDLFPDLVYGGLRITEGLWLRVNGPFILNSTYGFCTAFCFFITFYKLIIAKKKNGIRGIAIISILSIISAGMVLSLIRGIWIAWALGLFVWFLLTKKGDIKYYLIIISIIIFSVPFISKFQSSIFYNSRIKNTENIQFRYESYRYALSLFKKNPLFGIGFRNNQPFIGKAGQQHNQYISLLSETGLIGTSLYIGLICMLFYNGASQYKKLKGYIAKRFALIFLSILMLYVVTGLSLNSGYDPTINLFLFAAAGVALNGEKTIKRKN